MKVIYISGPLSTGDLIQNMRNAAEAAQTILDHGGAPYVPHLQSVTWQMFMGSRVGGVKDYDVWLPIDFEFVRRSDAVYRMPGYSWGGDREVEDAQAHGVPVFYTMSDVLMFLQRSDHANTGRS